MKNRSLTYIIILLFLLILGTYYFYTPASFHGPSFSIKYNRLAHLEHNKIADDPIEASGEVILKRRNYEIKITYIDEIYEVDPIKITNDLISVIESVGTIYNKSNIKQEQYNNYTFYTTKMIFSNGEEEAYIKYAIHYNEDKNSLYYFIYTTTNTPNEELEKILETFTIQ